MERLQRQIGFLLEVDKLKTVFRRNYLTDGSRTENDAEHSWYFAIAALVLCETARAPIDLLRVLQMALIHDLVEIDAGDTFIYDEVARRDQADREEAAARRIFGLLPEDQGNELRALWQEFEAGHTPDSRYARAIDRLAAVIMNHASGGKAWREHGVSKDRILAINQVIDKGAPTLWDHVRRIIDDAEARGMIQT
jgi:putative hydrolases of HD superfamily